MEIRFVYYLNIVYYFVYTLCTCSDINAFCLKFMNGTSLFFNLSLQPCVFSKSIEILTFTDISLLGPKVQRFKLLKQNKIINFRKLDPNNFFCMKRQVF